MKTNSTTSKDMEWAEGIDLITDLVVRLKEKQGTERQEVHAMIEETMQALITTKCQEARLDEAEWWNGNIDFVAWEKRLAQLKSGKASK